MRSRKTFRFSLVLLFLLGLESGGFQIVLLKMAEEFHLSGVENGSLVAAQYSAIIVMPLLFSMAAERVGKMKILHIFCFVFAAGCGIVITAGNYLVLLAGIFVVGSGYSVCESLVSAVLTDSYGEKAGRYLNLVQGAFSMGAVLGPHIAAWVKEQGAGWRMLFCICGIGYLLVWIALYFLKDNPDRGAREEKTIQKSAKGFSPLFYLLVLAFFLYGGMEVGISYYIDAYMQTELNSIYLSAWAVSLFWLSMIPSRVLSGMLYRYRKRLLIICFLLAAPVLLLLAVIENGAAGVALFVILGLAMGTLWPNLMGLATSEYQERSAMAAGMMSTGCGIGAVIFPLIFGELMEHAGLRNGFLVMAACSTVGAGLCICYHIFSKRA